MNWVLLISFLWAGIVVGLMAFSFHVGYNHALYELRKDNE
jgi:hypothetical protein